MPTLTVRLADETLAALRRQAEIEHRSLNVVTVLATQDRAAAVTRRAERRAVIGDLIDGNRELLEKLSR